MRVARNCTISYSVPSPRYKHSATIPGHWNITHKLKDKLPECMAAPVPTSILILSSTYYFPLSKGKWIEGRELCMLIGICFWEVEVRLETQAKITKRRWGLPLWYDSSGLGGSGTFLYLSFALKVGLCFFRAEGTRAQNSCQKRSRTPSLFLQDYSRKWWSVDPQPKHLLNPSAYWLM